MSKSRVLFCLKYRETSEYQSDWGDTPPDKQSKLLHSGLYNSATFVCNMLKEMGVSAHLSHCIDNNYIYKEINKFNPTHVIIEGFWVVPEKFDELGKLYPDIKFIIRNHSETPFLASEGIGIDWSLRYVDKPNVFISCNAPRMLEETRFLVKHTHSHWTAQQVANRVPYLPNFYPLTAKPPKSIIPVNSQYFKVGCYGAVRPLKNHLIQAIAAIKCAERLDKPLKFHINAGRIEMNGSPVLNNIKALFSHSSHELVCDPWRNHEDFIQHIRGMDLVSNCSLSETFNIVLADAVSVGVPIVASNEVPWASRWCIADPNNSSDVARVMELMYKQKRKPYGNDGNFNNLQRYNRKTQDIWRTYFI